jgi:uncharacterized protein with von Willebrand factor type A (vWA) domain
LLARAIRAINDEVSAGKSKTPNEAMADWVRDGPRFKERTQSLAQKTKRKRC